MQSGFSCYLYCWTRLGNLLVIGLSFLLSLLPKSVAAQTHPPLCRADLASQVEAITNRPAFRRARWGILIQTLSTAPETLYSQDADKFFIPASNVKLLTTAAALTQLGPDFRMQTSVYQIATGDQPTENQETQTVILRVVGRGDPSFSEAELKDLVEQIRQRGIRQIHQLLADDQYFQNDATNPNWEWEDVQAGYGAPVNSLILNQNAIGLTLVPQALGQSLQVQWDDPNETVWQIVNRSRTVAATASEYVQVGRDLSQPILYVDGQLRVGSAAEPVAISIPQPTQHFLDQLQTALASEQIRVNQTAIATDPLPTSVQPIAHVNSPPLAKLLLETNQQSNNLYAEALLRTLGRNYLTEQADHTSSLEAGINAVQAVLTRLGVDPDSYSLADGSGLSRQNLVTPAALVKTLQTMAQSPYAATYRASLPIAGTIGTLRSRFRDTPIQGNLEAKTGALRSIVALSGYLKPVNSPQLVLSILINHAEQPLGEVQNAIDAIVQLVAKLEPC